jgi:hypothetical protein
MRLQWLHMVRAKVTESTPDGTNCILSTSVVRWRGNSRPLTSAWHFEPARSLAPLRLIAES